MGTTDERMEKERREGRIGKTERKEEYDQYIITVPNIFKYPEVQIFPTSTNTGLNM